MMTIPAVSASSIAPVAAPSLSKPNKCRHDHRDLIRIPCGKTAGGFFARLLKRFAQPPQICRAISTEPLDTWVIPAPEELNAARLSEWDIPAQEELEAAAIADRQKMIDPTTAAPEYEVWKHCAVTPSTASQFTQANDRRIGPGGKAQLALQSYICRTTTEFLDRYEREHAVTLEWNRFSRAETDYLKTLRFQALYMTMPHFLATPAPRTTSLGGNNDDIYIKDFGFTPSPHFLKMMQSLWAKIDPVKCRIYDEEQGLAEKEKAQRTWTAFKLRPLGERVTRL